MLKSIKKFSGFVIALSFWVGLSGCPLVEEDGGSQTTNNQTIDKKATIQGGVFDATTGARLGGADLKMTLVQGTSHRSPSALITDTTNDLVGEYAFDGVPVNVDGGNITFKMVITNTGYQRFEGLVTFNVAEGELAATTDSVINLIRDVYLFPLGATAPDLEVAVEFDLEPVPGATVVLQQNAAANVATAETSGASRLVATTGLLPTLTATTDSAGKVTFLGANLVLGGAYTVIVLPIKHEDVPLERNIGVAAIVVGGPAPAFVSPIVVAMLETTPSTQDDGIFVVFASNRDGDDITGITNPGVMTLVFNRAVAFTSSSPSAFVAALTNGAAVIAATPVTTALSADGLTLTATTVIAVLSADRLTLTLTPQFDTAPVAGDTNLFVTYTGGAITVSGDEGDEAVLVFALEYLDGVAISAVVNIVGP